MIDRGFAKGITDNMLPVSQAMDDLKDITTSPFNSSIEYSMNATGIEQHKETLDFGMLDRLDRIIMLLEVLIRKSEKEIHIDINGRNLMRILKEMGVAFN